MLGGEGVAKKLNVEFRYLDRDGCSRCRETDKIVTKTMEELKKALKELDAEVIFKTRKLPKSKLHLSNSILINGEDLEKILNKNETEKTSICHGCSDIMKEKCECRAYSYKGKKSSHITKGMIKDAIKAVLKK